MSYIQISKQNLIHNISLISRRCGLDKFAAVLKDNAYGHGLIECAQICAEVGVKYAIVRDADAADRIAHLFTFVLTLSDISIPKSDNVHITINSISDIDRLQEETNIHLKIDSGMHRNGIDMDELDIALEKIHSKGLYLKGVLSHLRSADELSSETFWQEKNFLNTKTKILEFCRRHSLEKPIFHLHNSAGVFRKNSFEDFDMVRVGIAMYGYMELPSSFPKHELRPVMSLFANKISSRKLKTTQKVGYGGVGKIDFDKTVSVYDLGYSDGFFRLNEHKQYSLPSGSKIIGRVSMDNMIIDSDDESICIFDDARTLAKLNDTIIYDVLVKLSPKIRRIVL